MATRQAVRWPTTALVALVLSGGAFGCSERAPARAPAPAPVDTSEAEPAVREIRWERVDPPAAPGAFGASVTATANGLIATWIEPREEAHRVRFSLRQEGGWSAPTTVVEADDLFTNWADFPRAALGGDGAIYVHYLRRSGSAAYAYEIQLTRTQDSGQHFESLGVVHTDGTPTEHGFVSMLPTQDGVRLFWLDARASVEEGGATAVYTTRVNETIGTAERIDDRACDCCQTDAALTAAGPIVAFRDRADREVRDISLARWVDDAFRPAATVHRDGWEIAGCPVNGPAVAADARRVAVAWFTGADGGAARIAFSDDSGANFRAPVDVDPHQPPGRLDVALVDGGAAVSWLARGADGGEVRVRFVSQGGVLGAPTVVGATGLQRASGFPVMTRDEDHLYVAYRDGSDPAQLHVARLGVGVLPRTGVTTEEPETRVGIAVGDDMPDARVRNADDEPVALVDLSDDGSLLIAFFARWCQPCRDELRALEAFRGSHPDLRIVAVSLDEGSAARAEATARGWGFEGTVLRDADAAAALGVPPLPALFVFGPERRLRLSTVGQLFDADAVERALAPSPR